VWMLFWNELWVLLDDATAGVEAQYLVSAPLEQFFVVVFIPNLTSECTFIYSIVWSSQGIDMLLKVSQLAFNVCNFTSVKQAFSLF
jgi:hypothetical protein